MQSIELSDTVANEESPQQQPLTNRIDNRGTCSESIPLRCIRFP